PGARAAAGAAAGVRRGGPGGLPDAVVVLYPKRAGRVRAGRRAAGGGLAAAEPGLAGRRGRGGAPRPDRPEPADSHRRSGELGGAGH
ncbi:unnamed protein product, partial [Heterosigma akashiwo]